MTILDEIISHKREEVAQAKDRCPAARLEASPHFGRACLSLKQRLDDPKESGIIAEIKRRSPSKGTFKAAISVTALSTGYARAGASALSILTDERYFGGTSADLTAAREINSCPILRKDFIIDEYQVLESKAMGADLILLIAAALPPEEIIRFAGLARSLSLETLLEVHSAEELRRSFTPEISLVGVNNRDLRDFSVDIERSLSLAPLMPKGVAAIAESGISTPQAIRTLRTAGFRGFLVGEAFMAKPDPAAACRDLIMEAARP